VRLCARFRQMSLRINPPVGMIRNRVAPVSRRIRKLAGFQYLSSRRLQRLRGSPHWPRVAPGEWTGPQSAAQGKERRFHSQWRSSEWLAARSLQLYGLLGPPVGPEVIRCQKARYS
jgi:hypothetical protein